MAKKKDENKLSYLQMPLPSGRKSYRIAKRSWGSLNYRQTIDTGALSAESNISTLEAPYLIPSQMPFPIRDSKGLYLSFENPISIFGFDDFLLVIYRDDTLIKVSYITYDADNEKYVEYSSVLKENASADDEYPRCVVQFNKYIESEDIVNGEYTKRLLIFPDKKSMFFDKVDLFADENNNTDYDFKLYDLDATVVEYENKVAPYLPPDDANKEYYYKNTHKCDETMQGTAIFGYGKYETEDGKTKYGWAKTVPHTFPNIKYATVHLSRLFGVSDDSVYASGFNNYANWTLDTIDEYNDSNAWCSKAQSNTKADGNFTGITNFQGHVVCFKRDYMHEIYNNKNPFRIQDIYAEGAIDNRTIQDVDGKLIFVSDDNVKIYTGSNPRIISYNLNMPEYANAVSGTDGRCYYLYCEDAYHNNRLFVYDTFTDYWSEQFIEDSVLGFAHNKNGMYMLCGMGVIYKMDTEDYDHIWWFETDLITNETVNIKHIKKMQMLADIGPGAYVKVYALYDNEKFGSLKEAEKAERLLYSSSGSGQKAIRVKPRKTANYGIKLHIEGEGYVKLYELEMFIENGGGLYV